jgi:hypothetical protein
MTRLRKFVYAVFVGALLFAGIGIITARAWDVGALWPAAVNSADPDPNPGVADPDYVYGLAARGIVQLPSQPLPPLVRINSRRGKGHPHQDGSVW